VEKKTPLIGGRGSMTPFLSMVYIYFGHLFFTVPEFVIESNDKVEEWVKELIGKNI
jgi:hypothetical protein